MSDPINNQTPINPEVNPEPPIIVDENVENIDPNEVEEVDNLGLINRQDESSAIEEVLASIPDNQLHDSLHEHPETEHTESPYPVPYVDNDFYEQHFDDPAYQATQQYLENNKISPQVDFDNLSPEDKEALLASANLGIGATLRENAHLVQESVSNRKTLMMSFFVNVVLAILSIVLLFAFFSYPKIRYIPTKDNTAICEVTAENNPNITDATIANFAKDAVVNLYTMDYINWRTQTNDTLERWFTMQGRSDTIKAIQSAGITNYVEKNALTMRATNTGAPQIEQVGNLSDGTRFWLVRFPMLIDVFSGKNTPEDTQRYIVSVRVIADTASAQNPAGLGVNSVTLKPSDR